MRIKKKHAKHMPEQRKRL